MYNIIGGRLFNEVQPTSFPFRKMEITDLVNAKMAKLYRLNEEEHIYMFYLYRNGFISINRGDTFEVPLFINNGTCFDPVRFYLNQHPNALVYMGVMEPNQRFEEAIIKKKYDYEDEINKCGDLIVKFKSTDTEYLLPGKYYYEVKVLLSKYSHIFMCDLGEDLNLTAYNKWVTDSLSFTEEDVASYIPDQYNEPLQIFGINKKTKEKSTLYIQFNVDGNIDIFSKEYDYNGEAIIKVLKTLSKEGFLNSVSNSFYEDEVNTIIQKTDFAIME